MFCQNLSVVRQQFDNLEIHCLIIAPTPNRSGEINLHPSLQVRYCLASNTRLNGVSVARRNSENPPDRTTSFIASSEAMAPRAGPPVASEFDVQHKVEAPENVRPMILKFSSTVFPAIGSTIRQLPLSASVSQACFVAPCGSPIS